jgi:hypothetical protein
VVGRQQLSSVHVLAGAQRVAVLQQQPAGALDDPPAAPVPAQLVGAIDAHPVDDLAAVLGDHVEQVEDDGGVRAVRTHLQLVAGVHVHHGRPQPPQRSGPSSSKNGGCPRAPAAADPQHALAGRLDDHGGVAVALLDRELVQGDHLEAVEIDRAERALQRRACRGP